MKNEVAAYIIMGAGCGSLVFAFVLAMEAFTKVKNVSVEVDELVSDTKALVGNAKENQLQFSQEARSFAAATPSTERFIALADTTDETAETAQKVAQKVDRLEISTGDLKEAISKLNGIFSPTAAFLSFGAFLFTTALVVMGVIGIAVTPSS